MHFCTFAGFAACELIVAPAPARLFFANMVYYRPWWEPGWPLLLFWEEFMFLAEHHTRRIERILRNSELRFADLAIGTSAGLSAWCSWRRTAECESGRLSVGDVAAPPARYLVASLTKPFAATLAVQLAAEGAFWLNEPVRRFLPAFSRGPLRTITLRHLLTHTSGLPDMLPENDQLRSRHAQVPEFADAVSRIDPAFQPGTSLSYCSMGFAVLESVIRSVTGQTFPELFQQLLFQPLQLQNSWLGLPLSDAQELLEQTIACELPASQPADSNWHWNSLYWRTLGAPWGGLITTAADLGELLGLMLRGGSSSEGCQVLSFSVVESVVSNQTQYSAGLGKQDRLRRPWGYGWRFNWLDHSGCFCDLLPADSIGHWGATGTLMWADRRSGSWGVVLTNQPWERSQPTIQRLSNVLVDAGGVWREA